MWDLEWRPRVRDLKEGANICAWNAGFEGRKETSLMFLSRLDSKDTEEYLFFRIGKKVTKGLWVCSYKCLRDLRDLLCLRNFGGFVPLVPRSSFSFAKIPLFIEKKNGHFFNNKWELFCS